MINKVEQLVSIGKFHNYRAAGQVNLKKLTSVFRSLTTNKPEIVRSRISTNDTALEITAILTPCQHTLLHWNQCGGRGSMLADLLLVCGQRFSKEFLMHIDNVLLLRKLKGTFTLQWPRYLFLLYVLRPIRFHIASELVSAISTIYLNLNPDENATIILPFSITRMVTNEFGWAGL